MIHCTVDHPITMTFDWQMQNITPMTKIRSKSKPEVEFQYGGRPFSKTGKGYISAVDRDVLSNFGMEIDLCFLKRVSLIVIA